MANIDQQKGNCWKCGHTLTHLDYGRGDSCEKCRYDTHVCKNCSFYDTAYNNSCRESQAERVVDKEKSNFCDYFQATTTQGGKHQADTLKNAAEALFKKKS